MAALKTSRWRYLFPNSITIFAVFLSFLSVHYAIEGDYQSAAWFIMFCVIADTLDGGVARVLDASSQFGKELDSLSDVINLGVAPGILLYLVYQPALGWASILLGFFHIIAITGRLARFNTIGKESKAFFLGLPSPHSASAIATFVLFSDAVWGEYRYAGFVVLMVISLAAMMFSNMRFESSYYIAPGYALASWQGWVFATFAALMVIWPKQLWFILTLGMILQGPLRALRSKQVRPVAV